MKFMIVNAFGRSNRGDSVLLDECIHEIRAKFPDAEIAGAVFEGIDAAWERARQAADGSRLIDV